MAVTGGSRALEGRLRSLGIGVLRMPSIRIAPPRDRSVLAKEVGRPFDWVVLASRNAERAFLEAGGEVRASAAVGPGSSASLLRALRRRGVRGRTVLIPRSDASPSALPRALRRLGARVRCVTAYRTLPVPLGAHAASLLARGRVDAVVFASASAARSFASSCRRRGIPLRILRAVSIGPETSRALRREGFRISAEARQQTAAGLVRAVRKALKAAVA